MVDWDNTGKKSYSMEVMGIPYCELPTGTTLSFNLK